jgi:hypothetical protein
MGEQKKDEMGNDLHTNYEYDHKLKATIIPSGRSMRSGGGSFGFTPGSDIQQNIIAYDGDGETVITKAMTS